MPADDVARLSAGAAVASAMAGLLSVVLAGWVFIQSRRLLRPFERPVLSLVEGTTVQGNAGAVDYAVLIKNTGQRPATKIRFRIRAAAENQPATLVFPSAWEPANDYQPTGELLLILGPSETFPGVMLVQVTVFYADALTGKEFDGESYWLRTVHGDSHPVRGMDRAARKVVEPMWGRRWSESGVTA